MNQQTTGDNKRSDEMSSANVFLKMTLLAPEPAMPVRLVRHAAGRR